MVTSPGSFLSRFLFRIRADEYFWAPGEPPTQEITARAEESVKDYLGFEHHREAFTKLAGVIDICTSEELRSRGNGIAATNAKKHPRVLALMSLEPAERASIAAAAAQGLAWMEDCSSLIQEQSLRNQIGRRVMAAIVLAVGVIKSGYTSEQLSALVRIASALQDNDLLALRARGAIAEILAGNLDRFPREEDTTAAVRELIGSIDARSHAMPASVAMDKLVVLNSEELGAPA